MPIAVQCEDCDEKYRLPDKLAGKRVRCQECGAVISVPGGRRPQGRSEPDRGRDRDRSRGGRGSRGRSRRPQSSQKMPLLVGSSIAALLLLAGAGYVVMQFMGSDDPKPDVAATDNNARDRTAANPEADATPVKRETPEERMARTMAAMSDQDRMAKHETDRNAQLADQFKPNQCATIVFRNVTGDSAAAKKYLAYHLRNLTNQIESAGRKQTRQQTEANRKRAEQDAIRQGQIMFQYKEAQRQYGRARVVYGYQSGTNIVYHVGPALNLQSFATELGLGTMLGVVGREISIDPQLPNPIPDPYLEWLEKRYGVEKIYTVVVNQATGSEDDVKRWLTTRTARAKEKANGEKSSYFFSASQYVSMSRLTKWESKGAGTYQFMVMPVKDPQALADAIDYGDVTVDTATRTITVAANLPNPIPSLATMEKERTALYAEERNQQMAGFGGRPSIRSSSKESDTPKTELDRAMALLEKTASWDIKAGLQSLAKLDVEEEKRLEVTEALTSKFGETWFDSDLLIKALVRWCPEDKLEESLIYCTSKDRWGRELKPVIKELGKLKTETAARELAKGLTNRSYRNECAIALAAMGEIAENSVLLYLENGDANVRQQVYEILARVGTSRSAAKVTRNAKKEGGQMKVTAEECVKMIRKRIADQKKAAAGATN